MTDLGNGGNVRVSGVFGNPASIGKQVVTGIITALMGAALMLLLRSGENDQRLSRAEQDIRDSNSRIAALESELSTGGPPVLAGRVGRAEEDIKDINGKLDDIYAVTVLHQTVPLRQRAR